jgi:hypothetical protein
MNRPADKRKQAARCLASVPLGILGIALLAASAWAAPAVNITEGEYEGRPQFIVRTESATWYYDRAGGGISRLIDRSGRDWVAFSKSPLSEFPRSAGAGYRGLGNLVHGAGQRISIGFIETDEPLAVHEQVARRVTAAPMFNESGEACLKRLARWTTKRRAMAPPDSAAPENRRRTCVSVCGNYERRKR